MKAAERRLKLTDLKIDDANIAMTGIPLCYKGTTRTENAYRIPLKFLIYNKYNGRIGTEVKSYEAQNGELNAEESADCKIIENFLYNSKIDRNKKTMASLQRDKQQRYGIVTSDGVIIDGNRRAMLLNKLFHSREEFKYKYTDVEHCQYFVAVILPDGASEQDIQQLETIYQMGEDNKLDYNPIEKYLKCKELSRWFAISDIAEFMGEKSSQINNWLSILGLMEEYLETYGYEGIYTRLEKTEGPFVDLNNYLESYQKRAALTRYVTWEYKDTDISDLKLVCFDYIRARYEGKEFREIAKVGKDGCIFAYEDLWNTFLQEHNNLPQDEKTIEDLRIQHPNEDLSRLLKIRDSDWSTRVHGRLKGNLKRFTSKLDDKRAVTQPMELLEKALGALKAIDCNHESFSSATVLERIKEINKITWDMKKILEKK